MKTVIYHFSGTGNTLKITKELAARLGDVELIPMVESVRHGRYASSAERIGFVFPVRFWTMPLLVQRFLNNIDIPSNAYLFAVTTCGGTAGKTLIRLKHLLKKKGRTLSAGYVIPMPPSSIQFSDALPTDKQRERFQAATERLEQIVPLIQKKESGPVEASNLAVRTLTEFFSGLLIKKVPRMDKNFWVNDKCQSCGQCVRICPVHNVSVSAQNTPKWLNHCIQCLACLQWCPNQAIEYGKKTAKKARYHHPDIGAEEMVEMVRGVKVT